jgi:hypothetical protein
VAKQKQTPHRGLSRAVHIPICAKSALAGLEAGVRLVDDIYTALATDQFVIAMAFHQALEGIADFHGYTYMMAESHLNWK